MSLVSAYVYVWGRVDGTAGIQHFFLPAIIKLAASTLGAEASHHGLKDLPKVRDDSNFGQSVLPVCLRSTDRNCSCAT